MLRTLRIKNFALIAEQTINFKAGFNVLVGETGAGKSLILDALSFVLGEKSNKLNIRHGQQKMSVQAVFDCDEIIENFLNENDIDIDDGLLLTRSLNIDGKSDIRVNGTIVSVSILKQLSTLLVDTCAQNENIELLKVKNHLSILDRYAGDELYDIKLQISKMVDELSDIESQMEKFGGNDEIRARKLELLKYQIDDIENANLKIGEDDEVKSEIDRLANYEKIFESVKLSISSLGGVAQLLSDCERNLNIAEKYDDNIVSLLDRLKSSKIELDDIYQTLLDYDNSGYDENLFNSLNKRFDDIKLLKKKYGATLEEILNYLDNIKNEYDDLLFGEEKLKKLQASRFNLKEKLYSCCNMLSVKRREIAIHVEKLVINELLLLGFKNCNFKIDFKDLSNFDEEMSFFKNGIDNVEFLFSANAGEELKSLSKTISGGEMSRFMLALKNVFAKCFDVETLVFDEVDTGISGEIGQRVAERLAVLSRNYQLICITHLCQVTSMADNYIFVKKSVENGETYTSVNYLNYDGIIKYIAVVSGAEPTEVALKFAGELKEKAETYKKSL